MPITPGGDCCDGREQCESRPLRGVMVAVEAAAVEGVLVVVALEALPSVFPQI